MTIELNQQQIAKIIEGLLFVASEPVSIKYLSSVIDCAEAQIEAGLDLLKASGSERGIRLQRQGSKVQLVSAPELTDYVERFLGVTGAGKFSTPALETLAIIAYRQPITRPEIEAIRGVNSDGVLRTLISKGLVEEVGRLDSVGHPSLFATTFEFLRYFGLNDIDELPELNLPQIELPKNGSDTGSQLLDEEQV
ncbi:MAG: SMC-Scp complex subunit ScpB [Anaerolineaceae bacterium]|nr:SMC-Scp complex subunit ScpB [Anaerolineaceae bacterium]MCB9098068.1 SMC-Scp complex subunit ScpB [Anaerolineales bacterium]